MTRRQRTTTPDPSFIEQVGEIARSVSRQWQVQNIHDEVSVEVPEEDAALVAHDIESALPVVHLGTPTGRTAQMLRMNELLRMNVPPTIVGPVVTGRWRSNEPNIANIQANYNELEVREMARFQEIQRRMYEDQSLRGLEEAADRRLLEEIDRSSREHPDLSDSLAYVRRHFQEQVAQLEDEGEVEVVARTRSTRARRTGRATSSAPVRNPPLYAWTMLSSTPTKGGTPPQYEVRLNDDGSTSCNCPGWMYKKKDQPRGCKHTRHIEEEAADYYARHQRGEDLPTEEPTEAQREQLAVSAARRAAQTQGGVKFRRFVDID